MVVYTSPDPHVFLSLSATLPRVLPLHLTKEIHGRKDGGDADVMEVVKLMLLFIPSCSQLSRTPTYYFNLIKADEVILNGLISRFHPLAFFSTLIVQNHYFCPPPRYSSSTR